MVDEAQTNQDTPDEAQHGHPEEREYVPWYCYVLLVGIVLYMCVAWIPLFGY